MKKNEKEIHKIGDILTYQDIINIGLPEPAEYANISLEDLMMLGTNFNQKKLIGKTIYTKMLEDFSKEFPDCPGSLRQFENQEISIPLLESFIWFQPKSIGNNKNILKLDILNYFNEILMDDTFRYLIADRGSFFDYEEVALAETEEEQKELIKNYLRKKRDYIKQNRDSKSVSLNPDGLHIDTVYRHIIKYLNWNIRNLDRLYEYFNKPIDLEMLNCIDKDVFLAFYVFRSLHIFDWTDKEVDLKYNIEKTIEPTENYLLLLEYLKTITNHSYKVSFETKGKFVDEKGEIQIDTFTIDLADIKEELETIYDRFPALKNRESRINSYEELLSTRASETWKKLQQKEAIKRIKGYWELIPKGESLIYTPKSLTKPSVPKSNQERSLKLKESYDLLDDKMNFFESTNPVCELTGINTFDGYKAYIYSNSCVILEKFYTYNSKGKLVPTTGEAIYVMNLYEFMDLSKLTKPEIIEEINSYDNPNVYRIYHSKNWKNKVEKAISGQGYGYTEECIDYIEELAKELSSTNNKVKVME